MVVGLGNPGPEYEATRHNAGFLAIDRLAGRLRGFSGFRRQGAALRGSGRVAGGALELVKPQTYMNRSGAAVRALLSEGWIASEVLVVTDDVYLPFGVLRIRARGGTGGHQGLESIREEIGSTDFPRLRIGVGPAPPSADLPEFVLAPFEEGERERLTEVLDAAAGAAYDAAAAGLTRAMNQWNRTGTEPVEE